MPVLAEIGAELDRATKLHGPMKSAHEAYSVILEEVDEFWDEVKKRVPDKVEMRKELIQIAAMAARAVEDLNLE